MASGISTGSDTLGASRQFAAFFRREYRGGPPPMSIQTNQVLRVLFRHRQSFSHAKNCIKSRCQTTTKVHLGEGARLNANDYCFRSTHTSSTESGRIVCIVAAPQLHFNRWLRPMSKPQIPRTVRQRRSLRCNPSAFLPVSIYAAIKQAVISICSHHKQAEIDCIGGDMQRARQESHPHRCCPRLIKRIRFRHQSSVLKTFGRYRSIASFARERMHLPASHRGSSTSRRTGSRIGRTHREF